MGAGGGFGRTQRGRETRSSTRTPLVCTKYASEAPTRSATWVTAICQPYAVGYKFDGFLDGILFDIKNAPEVNLSTQDGQSLSSGA